jgi:hypothetical protein
MFDYSLDAGSDFSTVVAVAGVVLAFILFELCIIVTE